MPRCPSFISRSTLILILLGCISYCPSTLAQGFHPFSTLGPYSSFIENQALFVAGGRTETAPLPTEQAFMIDLSVPWNASNPMFKALPAAPAYASAASAISSDGNQWVTCYERNCHVYSVKSRTWRPIFKLSDTSIIGSSAATDPDSGLMYIPHAGDAHMMVMDPSTKTYERVYMPVTLLSTEYFSVAWSQFSRKLFLFGGTAGASGQMGRFNAYSYSESEQWKDLTNVMKGQLPSPRRDACLVPAYGGTKMILFGGFSKDKVGVLPDIYVLDVATMTWTKGSTVTQRNQRAMAACAASNDYFIAWGGGNGMEVIDSTIVYNIRTNNWTSAYNPAPAPTRPTSPNQGDSSDSGYSTRVADIVTAVLGVVVVALVAWIVLLYLKRARYNTQDAASNPESPSIPTHHHREPFTESLGNQHQWTPSPPQELHPLQLAVDSWSSPPDMISSRTLLDMPVSIHHHEPSAEESPRNQHQRTPPSPSQAPTQPDPVLLAVARSSLPDLYSSRTLLDIPIYQHQNHSPTLDTI